MNKFFVLYISATLMLLTIGAQGTTRYWVATTAGKWSDAANWASITGGAGGQSVPGAQDIVVFDGKGIGDSLIDTGFPGEVGNISVIAGYPGTITQERGLTVRTDMKVAGGSRVGWTFVEDKTAGLNVKGNLIIATGKRMTCSRSSILGEGTGRVIVVGKNLTVLGEITADGKGFMQGPGTPVLPIAKDDPNAAQIQDRFVGGANIEALRNAAPVSPAGPGHGGRGAGIYRNPNGQYTVTPHVYYWTDPLGSGVWRYPGGGTYGSVTNPMSLGSGTKIVDFDPKAPRKYDPENTFWQYTGAYGGGAVKLLVSGVTTVNGKITANGALAGETGASGGSVYLITGALIGNGVICANGSDGPGVGHGRGGGGGGRVAVVLKHSPSTGMVKIQAYGGEGRWSPAAAAGTIYLETPQDTPDKGALIVDNRNMPCRSMYDINTSLSDNGDKTYIFKNIIIKNHAILYIGKGNSLTASTITGNNGNLLLEGQLHCSNSQGFKSKEVARPQDEVTRQSGNPVTVYTLGAAYTLRQELLNRSCQLSSYPYQNRIVTAMDLSTYAYPAEVKGVKEAAITITRKSDGVPVAQSKMRFNDKQYAGATINLPVLMNGTYEVRFTLDNGMKPLPLTFERAQQAWEHNTLGETDKVYYPFEPVAVDGNTVKLSSGRSYQMNGFGLFDKVVSEGRELTNGPMVLKLETSTGLSTWKFTDAHFTTIKQNIAEYVSSADGGALSVQTKSGVEFDGCTRVEMDLLPGTQPEQVQRLWIEIPLKDTEMNLFHYTAINGYRWNYAGLTPRGGKIVWEPSKAEWKDRRPPIWSVAPGTEGQQDGLIWDTSNVRNVNFLWVNQFVPYLWLGGAERGLAWFADSDKGWIPDPNKPSQEILRAGDTLVLRIYLINKPVILTEKHHLVFGLQASPTRPRMQDWRSIDRFAIWGYMTPAYGMWCCSKFPIDHDFSLVDHAIQNSKDNAAGKPVNAQFVYDKVEALKAKGWPDDMTPQSYLDRWVIHPWNDITKVGPMKSVYFDEHWTDPGQTDMDTYGDDWSARVFTGYWSIREKNRIVYDSPYMVEAKKTGPFVSGNYTNSLVDFSVYYANQYLKRGISLYFDTSYPHISMDPNSTDAYVAANGQIQPSVGIWAQRSYYRRIWNLTNAYNEQGMNPPLWFSQHMTNTMILPMHTWTTCNLDNEATWTDVARNITPAVFPWDYLLTETTGGQVGIPGHSHFAVGGKDATPRREWGMRRVHEITNMFGEGWRELDKLFLDFGYGKAGVQVINYWNDDPPFKVSNNDVKWIGMIRTGDPGAMLLLQSYSFDPTTTKVSLPGYTTWKNAETGAPLATDAEGIIEVNFKEGYGTVLLVASTK